ncbi:extracellular solute-binding protein [Streptomyces sp. WAC05374]|uniref:ABC transporter substrate-binding protein n=1 Tax=Streptomyces sp. WAC05374 TaxID=2487420 RepID=UPI000F885110|nr:extracellular solute-binding protein [Streptomyces sp. WAC05374]RST06714.1 extracellular solute-binding protein [Streptomyces sp. WAC05374]TDF44269.1 extracellular solute-binding protein [Streptomyces sp. WAC05374]TDF53801.1 extracellular solute-binding protein [Streptomyces sp. WAC05374]TDF58633.1 extracellular solute-binding protein [Streptomyces sp. WAC05374]
MRAHIRRLRRRALLLAAAVVLGAVPAAGCAPQDPYGRTRLTVGLFGTFGYEEAGLYAEYMRLHPDVVVEQTSIQRNENYYPQLLTHLVSDSGLADVQAVEAINIAEVTATQADRLVDLGRAPGVRREDFLPWKWAQATTRDGRTVGLGTDIGPQAVCYRKDLFARAGLPTDREAVGRLWAGDWRKFLETGKRYRAKAPAGTAFTDSASGVLSAITGSSARRYYDEDGTVVYRTNPAVREAWDIAAAFATEGLTARLQQFTPAWDQAFANGAFATVSCPAWMLGYIEDKAGPAGEDRWDVAAAPRPANWGGSFLVVPTSGRHVEEAAELAAWLTAPAQQAKLFQRRGSFPSASAAHALPAVAGARHPYFGDAPIGRIYTRAAQGVPVTILGPKDLVIAQNLADIGMLQVDQKGRRPEDGWDAAVRTIDNALDL